MFRSTCLWLLPVCFAVYAFRYRCWVYACQTVLATSLRYCFGITENYLLLTLTFRL
uniref:Uncharacterized protein n=1 Tax=Arundo donax TaxID=35708 RepID=A0A0A9FDY3_ARUDO